MYAPDLDLVYVQKALVDGFSLSELRTLCVMVGVNPDEIAGDTLSARARELVIYCYRFGRLPDLLERSKELNPRLDWAPAARTVYRQAELPDEWAEPLQQMVMLARDFNRNRALPFSHERTRAGDEIAFRMRELAPFCFGQIDVAAWLGSDSAGKRLAALKYLDWVQDVEHFGRLLTMLAREKPFVQFHLLLLFDSLFDQLSGSQRRVLRTALLAYRAVQNDPDLRYWQARIMERLDA